MDQVQITTDNQRFLVRGVSSSFRVNPFTGKPMYLSRADGPNIFDLNGNKYIDFFMGYRASPLGHNHPEIRRAIEEALDLGFYAEFDNPLTGALAEKIHRHIPCAEKVRYVNSGSEGTLLALRLARGYTKREKIVRIDGHFHGVHDYTLADNLAGKIDRKNPGDQLSRTGHLSAGIPQVSRYTLYFIPWNRGG